jgi:recombination protein U
MRVGYQITKAHFLEPAFLDYIGLVKGKALAFDAKETQQEEGFPLKNLKPHQFNYMQEWQDHGGTSFLLIRFVKLNKIYRLDMTTLSWYWEKHENKEKGFSYIPLNEFEANCKLLDQGRGICLDYLEGLEV